MDKIEDGGPAFPCDPFLASEPGHKSVAKRLAEGMSLRDYFAAKAMQGWLASYGPDALHPEQRDASGLVAAQAYALADAMLAARAKATGTQP